MLLLDIMKETLEDYILKNFRLLPGHVIELSKSNLYAYINGVRCVIVYSIKCYDIDRYVIYCTDEDGHPMAVNAENVYMSKLSKLQRILYCK